MNNPKFRRVNKIAKFEIMPDEIMICMRDDKGNKRATKEITFPIDRKHFEVLKRYAAETNKTLNEVFEEVMLQYIEKYKYPL